MTQGNRQEAVMTTRLLNPKRITNIATWNIRTMLEAGKASQVAREMENYRIMIAVRNMGDAVEATRPATTTFKSDHTYVRTPRP